MSALNLILVLYVTMQVIWLYIGIIEIIRFELDWNRAFNG